MTASRSRRVALLGIFAILFQALLFGWHHHDLAFAARGAPPTLSSPASGNIDTPATDADECEICIALHHQAAAPLAFMVPPVPADPASVVYLPDLALPGRGSERVFQARAPPRA
jgi:hypothetical protein